MLVASVVDTRATVAVISALTKSSCHAHASTPILLGFMFNGKSRIQIFDVTSAVIVMYS